MASKKDPITEQRVNLVSKAMAESALHASEHPNDDAPINVEMFSCSGGFAEGFKRAGVLFDLVIEFMPNHADSYQINIGHRPICMDARDFLRMIRMRLFKRQVRLIVADPPCTPWSRSGKREGLKDDRDMLTDTCEIIRLLQPDAYPATCRPRRRTEPPHRAAGHQRTLDRRLLHRRLRAPRRSRYGVPQHRVRPFQFGHRQGTRASSGQSRRMATQPSSATT